MPGLGDEFRAAREARHLSLSDVSEQIHIRSVYLEAIENDDPSFSAPVYVRGFVRTYARFLGLDAEQTVAHLNIGTAATASGSREPVVVAARPTRNRPTAGQATARRPTPWLALAALAATILVGFVAYRYLALQRSESATTGAAIASATPAPAASVTRVAEAPVRRRTPVAVRTLQVRLTADSWLSVKVDGAAVLEGIAKAGTVKTFHGKNVALRAGNAGGVDLTLNGKKLGAMGATGAVVERQLKLAGG